MPVNNNVTRAGQIMGYVSMAQQGWSYYRSAKHWYREKFTETYKLEVDSEDVLYEPAVMWLQTLCKPSALDDMEMQTYWKDDVRDIALVTVADSTQEIEFAGNKYTFWVGMPPANEGGGRSDVGYQVLSKSLHVLCDSQQAQTAIVDKFRTLVSNLGKVERKAHVAMFSKYGWEYKDAPLRPLDSVVLTDGFTDHLEQDMARFLDAEIDYVKRGIPWHRGYLFDGPPGSGKTSLAKGIAHEFKMDIYYLPVSDVESNTDLGKRVQSIPPRSILLLEDIDTAASATDREDSTGVNMSGLLNVLDGIVTPHGLITIMTTNHKESIDDAVIRPGRIDLSLHIGYCDNEQANRLFKVFYGVEPSSPIVLSREDISTATLTEIFKQHMYDPVAAEKALLEEA